MYAMYEDDYLDNSGTSDDFYTYNNQGSEEYDNSDKGDNVPPFPQDWQITPSGDKCPWCKDGLSSPFEAEDSDDADMHLCRGHVAEYEGLSLDGLDRMESELYADQL